MGGETRKLGEGSVFGPKGFGGGRFKLIMFNWARGRGSERRMDKELLEPDRDRE